MQHIGTTHRMDFMAGNFNEPAYTCNPTRLSGDHMRRLSIVALLLLSTACRGPSLASRLAEGKWVDLTYDFDSTTIYWPTAQPFRLTVVSAQRTPGGYYYAANNFAAAAHGDIPQDAIVLIRTGWGSRWPDRARYLGTTKTGAPGVRELHFPGLDLDAARALVRRRVKAVGIDTPSIDYGQSKTYQVHRRLFASNIPAFENVANLDQLPITGAYVIALPMKIKGGSGGPLRIVALLPPP